MRPGLRDLLLVLIAFGATSGGIAAAQSLYRETDVTHGGLLTGSVRLLGDSPHGAFEEVKKDADYCGKKKPSPRLLVGRDNGVGNAVVWIDRIGAGKKFGPSGIVTLRQRKCEYDPHLLVLGPKDQLEIVNGDPILHNVHTYDMESGMRSVFNIAQPVRGFRTHVRGEDWKGVGELLATCDAGHPWMSAYIIRTPHPYYSVTDRNGKFRLDDVPAGTYLLKMWHEGVAVSQSRGGPGTPPVVEEPYVASQQITVIPGETRTVNFEFSLRMPTTSK